jgi:hypothetical protein
MQRIAQALGVTHKTISQDLGEFVPEVQSARPKGGRPKGSRPKKSAHSFTHNLPRVLIISTQHQHRRQSIALMTITLDDQPGLHTRAAKVSFATRAVNLALMELGRCGGNVSNGPITGQDAAGVPNTSLGIWMFDTTEGG